MSLDHLWAGWRTEYVEVALDGNQPECVFCAMAHQEEIRDEEEGVLWRGHLAYAVVNKYPYTSGHLMVTPMRHIASIEDMANAESIELWAAVQDAVRAVRVAYEPHGVNVGANLGRAAGAGIPGHVHIHILPRWNGDSNFMSSIAEARVLPEALSVSAKRIREAWPR